ncbi:MAG: amidohydrolase family protein [Elusimicrobia bacterium]|nr:amidohydrolase family protein [Elusimicrobiota bacterium]
MNFDLVITGARVCAPSGIKKADICVRGGKIAALHPHGTRVRAGKTVDASGLVALPGVVDPHVHFQLPIRPGLSTIDDFRSGSLSALCGGVTTVIDYTAQPCGVPLETGLSQRLAAADGNMHCDYGLHCVIPSWKKLKDAPAQMRRLIRLGVPSFKLFMIYEERGMQADDADILSALEASRGNGALVCLHAESQKLIDFLLPRCKDMGMKGHSLSRPCHSEWEAVQRALAWASYTGGKIYFVHLSCGISAMKIDIARRTGVRAWGETCPQYLTLEDSVFSRRDGHYYATCPQIKTAADSRLLWDQLQKGVYTIGTDSCAFSRAQKDSWGGDFTKVPYGMPGVETALPVLYTYGVKGGKLALYEMVRLMSENPARIMGLYPQKGALLPGSDADIVLLDPDKGRKADCKKLHSRCDWTPYQGRTLYGWPEKVFLRGTLAVDGGQPVRQTPGGRFLRRKISEFF